MGLFDKKPGGSFFGNIIRGVGSTLTGGLIGTGKGVIGKEWDLNADGKFSKEELEFYSGISKETPLGTGGYKGPLTLDVKDPNDLPLIDLNNIIKLPTVETSLDKSTKSMIWIVAGFFGFILLFKMFSPKR